MRSRLTDDKGSVSTKDVLKQKSWKLEVFVRDLDERELVVMGLRQEFISVGKGKDAGGVDCGAGLGTDFLILRWKDKAAFIRVGELFKEWVKTFAPEDAKRMSL